MKVSRTIRFVLAVATIGVATGAYAIGAGAEARAGQPHPLQITFDETRVSLHEPAGLGLRQVISSGVGTFAGYGAATELVAVSMDLTATPCGPGSSTSTVLRRVVLEEGTLILKTLAHRCPSATGGISVHGRFEVDGAASTGVFAGARGFGSDNVEIPPQAGRSVATISGVLFLARRSGAHVGME